VQHPVVGAGLETLLHLEHRYETKRVGRISEAASLVETWRPGIALVDGVLLRDGERAPLGVPAIVLTGNAIDGEGLQRTLDDPHGWLRKDPTARELFATIDRVCGAASHGLYVRRAALIAAIAGTGVMLFLAWGFLALHAAG
jgi:hypothetical protein